MTVPRPHCPSLPSLCRIYISVHEELNEGVEEKGGEQDMMANRPTPERRWSGAARHGTAADKRGGGCENGEAWEVTVRSGSCAKGTQLYVFRIQKYLAKVKLPAEFSPSEERRKGHEVTQLL